jgi:hypothetical protein
VGGGMGGRCVRYGWIGGRREKVRGLYGFSSLVKQNKKGKNCAVFCFAGKRNFFFYIYDVITWGEKKSSANHYYSCAMRYDEQASRTLRRNVVSHRGSSSSAIGVTSAGAHLSTNSEQRRVRGKNARGRKIRPTGGLLKTFQRPQITMLTTASGRIFTPVSLQVTLLLAPTAGAHGYGTAA